jgi:hypothetical protein
MESAVLIAGLVAAGMAIYRWSPAALVFMAPLFVVASLWYFRLLGRIGWVLAEKTMAEADLVVVLRV